MDVQVYIDVSEPDSDFSKFTQHVDVEQRALDAVLFDFNPAGNPKVTRIKALCAALIQEMHDLQADPASTSAQKRMAAIAITQMELTQMALVKALFARG